MMGEYVFSNCFIGLTVAACWLIYTNWRRGREMNKEGPSMSPNAARFASFQRRYLIGYTLAVFGDWMQGPYMYILYENFGYTRGQIALLYIVGYASSLFFGTIVGSLADKYGMKNFSILYGVLYGLSSFMKIINVGILMFLSRVISGIGTSLLFSVFDSWVVKTHKMHNFTDAELSQTFARAGFLNGLAAVAAGILSSFLSDVWGLALSYKTPFIVSGIVLFACAIYVYFFWENDMVNPSGSVSPPLSPRSMASSSKSDESTMSIIRTLISNAYVDIRNNKNVACTCLIQSLFEAAMYVFVFIWTPAVKGPCKDENFVFASFGWIFSAFMIAVIVGSQTFEYFTSKGTAVGVVAKNAYLAGSAALAIASITGMFVPTECTEYSTYTAVMFIMFSAFELICGIYFPAISTIKSTNFPERSRAALMNIARVGPNVILMVVLLLADFLSNGAILGICTVGVFGAWFFQSALLEMPANVVSGGANVDV